ncbi:BppU family phage baseplate upper protein [Bacillus cereus]|uniref:BppU family phage baseplate upper protein n=2 Tax=Bacillus cereus group TaxID=86661 RepID=UPI0025424455|nr:BppU family phage baseplate upper protein [Bacillus anthracis]MDA1758191.1 BppU family phage baseplate upper protein [Bacillus cereus]MDA2038482.1 BppU family phage baseplate upper protein [Bacillus cereus]MDA2124239.1 BppU family phage baseplate upper protein [Bacillus cereus]HDR4514615.1 BppU family phage baseplate upper protein [Bacillus cereus]
MRTETMLIDLANMSMTRTISSRENDRNGFKVIVNLKERGKPVDLTGYVVKYEAISPYGNFVRDDAVVTNARDGIFEYIVSKEAVSSSGVWIGYFAFEKGTERFTTQDIRISLGSDVKQGNIPIENYIAEFDKLKKQIDALQIAVDKADVVKKTGDTMTGKLWFSGASKGIAWQENSKEVADLIYNGRNIFLRGKPVDGTVYNAVTYDIDKNYFNVQSETNLVKKSGDTMTGQLTINRPGTKDATLILQNGGGLMRVMPYEGDFNYIQSGTLDSKAKSIYVTGYNISEMDKFQVKAKELIVEGTFKQSNDVAWTNLTLINGATTDAGNTPRYMRQGDVIYIVGAVTNVTDSMTIANLPTGLRPTSNCAFAVAYLSTDSKKYTGEINVRPDGRITLDWMWNNVKSVSFCISYHL